MIIKSGVSRVSEDVCVLSLYWKSDLVVRGEAQTGLAGGTMNC